MKNLLAVIDSTKYVYYWGTTDKMLITSSFFFGALGILVMCLLDVGTRDPNTPYSPHKFSWSFFIKDNAVKFLLDIILVAVFIRFIPDFFHVPMNQFFAFLIGMGADKLASYAKIARDKLLPLNTTVETQTVSATLTSSMSTTNQNSESIDEGTEQNVVEQTEDQASGKDEQSIPNE